MVFGQESSDEDKPAVIIQAPRTPSGARTSSGAVQKIEKAHGKKSGGEHAWYDPSAGEHIAKYRYRPVY